MELGKAREEPEQEPAAAALAAPAPAEKQESADMKDPATLAFLAGRQPAPQPPRAPELLAEAEAEWPSAGQKIEESRGLRKDNDDEATEWRAEQKALGLGLSLSSSDGGGGLEDVASRGGAGPGRAGGAKEMPPPDSAAAAAAEAAAAEAFWAVCLFLHSKPGRHPALLPKQLRAGIFEFDPGDAQGRRLAAGQGVSSDTYPCTPAPPPTLQPAPLPNNLPKQPSC